MDFRLLGPLEVSEDGRELALGSRKQRALLALLVLRAGTVVPRDRLIDDLWHGSPPPAAAATLRAHISRLRSILGASRLVSRAPGYQLVASPDEVDAVRCERRFESARKALAQGEAARAADELRDVLGAWRGPVLADVADEPFVQSEASRLEELRLAVLEERIEADLALARHAELVGELEVLVSEHPFRERLRAQLMLALYRCGRQAEALETYQKARRLFVDELGIEAGRDLQALQRAILNQDAAVGAAPPEPPKSDLPAAPSRLIGRRLELQGLSDLLLGEPRLVSLTGAGGSGKTRLALEIAHALEPEFEQRVWFVPLASVQPEESVAARVLAGLGITEAPTEQPLETLGYSLRPHPGLLVLDNFEHLLQSAPLLAELLASCPRLKVLVTSRAPLNISGEHEYTLDPLPIDDAVQLFTERARAVRPGFAGHEAEVAEICARLDCLPLALELGAARSRLLAPRELLARLENRLDLAVGGPRDLPARQRTLRATLDWSYDLLEPFERRLLARLAVFAGSWSLEAAEEVCDADLTVLQSLVEQNLVRREGDRFGMLETIREFASERFERTAEAESVRRRHAEHVASLAEAAEPHTRGGPDHELWLERLEREYANVRAAMTWAHVAAPELALRILGSLMRLFWIRPSLLESKAWLEHALAADSGHAPGARAKALLAAADITATLGEFEAQTRYAEESFALYSELGDDFGIARALRERAFAAGNADDHERAEALYAEAITLAKRIGDTWGEGVILNELGDLALREGRWARALALCSESRELRAGLGDRIGASLALANIALAELELGRRADAERHIRQALAENLGVGSVKVVDASLLILAALATGGDQHARAARLLGAGATIVDSAGMTREPAERDLRERAVASSKAALGEDAWSLEFERGRGFSPREALECALGQT